jgi:hypothetical protein
MAPNCARGDDSHTASGWQGTTLVNIDDFKLRFAKRDTTTGRHALRLLRHAGMRFVLAKTAAGGNAFTPAQVAAPCARNARVDNARQDRDPLSSTIATLQAANARDIVSALLGCWPEPSLAVARRAGITKVELHAWLAGTGVLPDDALSCLMAIFGLTPLNRVRCESGADAESPVATARHYVLIAGNAPERVATIHNVLIGASPIGASAELVPAGHAPGHCWRYLLIMRQRGIPSLICFPRIGRSARILDNGDLEGFCGQITVNPNFYDAVQALRAAVEQRPTRVLSAMCALHRARAADIAQTGARMRHIAEQS